MKPWDGVIVFAARWRSVVSDLLSDSELDVTKVWPKGSKKAITQAETGMGFRNIAALTVMKGGTVTRSRILEGWCTAEVAPYGITEDEFKSESLKKFRESAKKRNRMAIYRLMDETLLEFDLFDRLKASEASYRLTLLGEHVLKYLEAEMSHEQPGEIKPFKRPEGYSKRLDHQARPVKRRKPPEEGEARV